MRTATATAASLLLALGLAPAPARALAGPEFEEIVVSARKLDERPQDVPLAIDVLGAAELARAPVEGLQGLAQRAPGLTFDAAWGGALSRAVLRGQQQPTLAGDNVGMFVDGVYQANLDMRDVEPLDIERIEVVRGPQGTLYGRSSFAGAIHYIAARPSAEPAGGLTLDGGSDDLAGGRAWISGPLGSGLRARVAAGWQHAGGTHENGAPGGGSLGDSRRHAFAATLATAGEHDWSAALAARYTGVATAIPAYGSLDYHDFNCGARVPSPAAWSYYCGEAPTRPMLDLSEDIEDSSGHAAQLALRFSLPLDGMLLEGENSWYQARFAARRDVDASSAGDPFGVCRVGVNCSGPPGVPRSISRAVRLNIEDTFTTRTEEYSTEWRLRSDTESPLQWMAGATWFNTSDDFVAFSAVPRGDLQADERLTELLPATPLAAGPLSALNAALVDDPDRQRVPRTGEIRRRRTLAAFGTLDYAASERLDLRAELRATREKLELRSLYDTYLPGFGDAAEPETFDDLLPRFSASFRQSEALAWYVSAAKGARSGGINANVGLIEQERRFKPEYNWTWELGLRYRGQDWLRAADITAFRIDWSDTQIRGLSQSPGVTGLVVGNTAGLRTDGVELAVQIEPAPWIALDFSASWIDARFRHGSESPGDLAACGVNAQNAVSDFCTIGPTRSDASGRLVPWVDGNRPARVPRTPWHAGLTLSPPALLAGWDNWLRLDLSHQGNGVDSPVGGFSWGRRTLLDARLGFTRAGWSLELWGRNLTDAHYIRSTANSFPLYYRTQPRPIDLFPGEGRRAGITLKHDF